MKLQDWKKWKRYDLAKLADKLGISLSFASLLLNGKRGVSPEMAIQIEKNTDGQVRRDEVMWPE